MNPARVQLQQHGRTMWVGAAVLLLAAIAGCNDPDVNQVLLEGLGSFLKAVVDAFILVLLPDPPTSPPATAWIMDTAAALLC